MGVRVSLRTKIGAFAVLLVAGACAAVWLFAVYLPETRERERRQEQYTQLAKLLGVSGALLDSLTRPGIHPDLAYVVRARGGAPSLSGSTAHEDRLAPLDADLAAGWRRDRSSALAALYPLRTGARPGLVVKRVNLRTEIGDEEILLGFSTLSLDEALRDRLRRSLIVLAVAVLLAIGGAAAIAARVTRPVRALSAGMERIGNGAFEPVAVESSDEVGLLARAFNDMVRGLKERERLKGTLARYVSDDVAARILTERSDLDLAGELREVTVLFLDIRGFTSLSERLPPSELVAMLNEYFEAIIEIVYEHHGTVNKFIGDAIMAIYGAPAQIDDPAMRAVRSAVEIEQQVALLNQRRREQGRHGISVGIGINTGAAVAGNIGSARRMEYTVIGDEVNLAQRLEGLAREGEILISGATLSKVHDRVETRAREPVIVKGKSLPVQVHEVVGLRG